MKHRVRAALVTAFLLAGVAAGVAAWFLAGRSPAAKDSWSSVLGGIAALVFGIVGAAIALAGLRPLTDPPDDGAVHDG